MCYDYTTVSFMFSFQRFVYKYFERIKCIELNALNTATFISNGMKYVKFSIHDDYIVKRASLLEISEDTNLSNITYDANINFSLAGPEDSPAIKIDNNELWLNEFGTLHRKGGPAIVTDTYVSYFVNGKCHRDDGPAYKQIYPDSNNVSYSWVYGNKNITSDVVKFAKINGIKLGNLDENDLMLIKLYMLQIK